MEPERQKMEQVWEQMMIILKDDLGEDSFKRWMEKLTPVRMSETQIEFIAPDDLHLAWVEINHKSSMQMAAVKVLSAPRELVFSLPGKPSDDFADDLVPRKKATNAPKKVRVGSHNLNPNYTFSNYVMGENNQLAYSVGVAVATSDKSPYNPLFIHGDSGVGKTHLMHAIGNEIIKRNPSVVVLYKTSEEFTNEYIDAITSRSIDSFRRKYRKVDVLLLDDVQFLSSKEKTQQEFFHTFNELFQGHKHLVFSSDRPASEIADLESRLTSRFECGGTVEIIPPELDTRLAILRQKRAQSKVNIDDNILNFLAQNIRRNVRRLEGAFTRVAMFVSISGISPTMEKVETLLRDVLREDAATQVSINSIQRHIAKSFSITLEDMCSKRRPASLVRPRQIAMYLSRKLTTSSLEDIGQAFGGRDHGTVIHANKTVAAKISSDKELGQLVAKLESEIC